MHEEGLEPHYEVQTPERTVVDTIRSGETHLVEFCGQYTYYTEKWGQKTIVSYIRLPEY